MTTYEKVYKTIKNRSVFIIKHGDDWSKAISSAKNYVCTPDMKHWTFGKSAGINNTYHKNGGAAKKWLYSLGFIDVLKFPDGVFKKQVIKSFSNWAKEVECFDIIEKFKKDQKASKRFELLVHETLLDEKLKLQLNIKAKTQDSFDEGFKVEIVREIAKRDKAVVIAAKEKYGTKCSVCKFDFGKTYGLHGDGFIEMHHLFPISLGKRKTKVEDLLPVCPNCHRMLHRGSVLLEIEELKEIIKTK
jgi:predicted HNH restriction endonuclease